MAALNGSKEIGFTIVSMTLSLAAVFIPILFMSGILGRLFREFAVTICAAILISGMVSVNVDAHAVQPLPAGHRKHREARLSVPRGLRMRFEATRNTVRPQLGLGAARTVP